MSPPLTAERLKEMIAGEKGHGRLTATNWIDHGCPTCRVAELEGQIAELTRDRDVWKGMHEGLRQSYGNAMQRLSEQGGELMRLSLSRPYQVDPNDTGEWCKNCGIAKIKSTRTDCVWSGGASSTHDWVIGGLTSQSPKASPPSSPDTET